MKKVNQEDASHAFATLSKASMSKGDTAAKLALVSAITALKAVAEGYEDFMKTAREKAKPADYDEMAKRVDGKAHTPEEINEINMYFMKYDAEVRRIIAEGTKEAKAVDLAPWTDAHFSALLESNPNLEGGDMALLHELLVAKGEKK